jgi:hypothetical protein
MDCKIRMVFHADCSSSSDDAVDRRFFKLPQMRLSLCIFFLFLAKLGLCQVDIKNTDLLHDDSAIVFRDVINHFKIEGIKDFKHHQVVIDGGMLSLIGENRFLVTSVKSNEVKIHVFLSGKTSKEICTRVFHVEDAGEPTVQLQEKYDQTLSNGQVINQTSLEVSFVNPNYTGIWQVAHFEISLRDPAGNRVLSPSFVSGKYLGKVIYDKINELQRGGTILFSQVILTYPDGGYHQYKDFSLRKK